MEKQFTLFWLTGETEIVKGKDIATAMNNAGIGNGALRALDFYAEGDKEKDYTYVNANKGWQSKEFIRG